MLHGSHHVLVHVLFYVQFVLLVMGREKGYYFVDLDFFRFFKCYSICLYLSIFCLFSGYVLPSCVNVLFHGFSVNLKGHQNICKRSTTSVKEIELVKMYRHLYKEKHKVVLYKTVADCLNVCLKLNSKLCSVPQRRVLSLFLSWNSCIYKTFLDVHAYICTYLAAMVGKGYLTDPCKL